MKYRIPLTWRDIRIHLQYSLWKYLLIFALSFGIWNLIYAQTAYRPPQEKRIDIYIQAAGADQEKVNEFMVPIWKEVVPHEELVNAVLLMSMGYEADYYANVQLMTYLHAGEGDIYILNQSIFKRLAGQGAFVDLEPYIQNGTLNPGMIKTEAGRVALTEEDERGEIVATGESALFGIPARELYAFATELAIDNRNLVLAVAANSGNEEDTVIFLNALIQRTLADMPDFLKQ
jgi:hypothetical protein